MTLFADKDAIVAEMRSDRLLTAGRTYFPGVTLSDDYIYAKVLAAEKDAERRLRVFVEPVEVLPEGYIQADIDALQGARWVEEPAYDFDPEMFRGEQWGYLVTRHRPIVAVKSFVFAYPVPANQVFSVPSEWIRVDKKYGHIRLVPTGTSFYAPLNAYIMSAVGGGRTIPHMLRVRYTTGLVNAKEDYPDLMDMIKKIAVLSVVDDQYTPQSGSISADGLSESFSVDVPKYKENIEVRVATLRQAIHGIRMMVV